eukprot:2049407-Amphidinium_carterae.1
MAVRGYILATISDIEGPTEKREMCLRNTGGAQPGEELSILSDQYVYFWHVRKLDLRLWCKLVKLCLPEMMQLHDSLEAEHSFRSALRADPAMLVAHHVGASGVHEGLNLKLPCVSRNGTTMRKQSKTDVDSERKSWTDCGDKFKFEQQGSCV